MATKPLGADSARVITPPQFPPAAAGRIAARMLDRFNRDDLGNAIEVLVELLDLWDGDSDLEGECSEDEISRCTDTGQPVRGDGPGCRTGDEGEAAWIEWTTMRGSQKRGPNIMQEHEDDEEDDPAGQYDEDAYTGPAPKWIPGPGCSIADPGEYEDGF